MKQESFIDKVGRPSRELQRSQDYIHQHNPYIREILNAKRR